MILERMNIELQTYGENNGKYAGKCRFASEHGAVEIRISDGHARRILDICSEAIVIEAEKVAEAMIAPVLELDAKPPEFLRISKTTTR